MAPFFCRIIRAAKNTSGSINLQLAEGEIILDVDGTVPTQPILQHIGISAWPGKSQVGESGYIIFNNPCVHADLNNLK